MSEIHTLANTPSEPFRLTDGVFVVIRRMKTIELFKMLKILTRGGAGLLAGLSLGDRDGSV